MRIHIRERLESFCARILEAAGFIHDHHVKRPIIAVVLHEPRYILTVDDVDVGGRIQCFQPPRLRAEDRLHSEDMHSVPFRRLTLPRCLCDFLRGDDKHLTDGEACVLEMIDR